jgi:hypothetical protein
MKAVYLAGALLVAGCATQPPQTPAQAMVDVWAGFGSSVAAFNVYAAQRPFCDQPNARPAPLCADRHIVIEGDQSAKATAAVLDQTDAVLKATTLRDQQWAAIGEAVKRLADFRRFVGQAKGETP